ncbi:hypothetical protein IAT38_003995 [Cryptococcus sp. DSM 104549]
MLALTCSELYGALTPLIYRRPFTVQVEPWAATNSLRKSKDEGGDGQPRMSLLALLAVGGREIREEQPPGGRTDGSTPSSRLVSGAMRLGEITGLRVEVRIDTSYTQADRVRLDELLKIIHDIIRHSPRRTILFASARDVKLVHVPSPNQPIGKGEWPPIPQQITNICLAIARLTGPEMFQSIAVHPQGPAPVEHPFSRSGSTITVPTSEKITAFALGHTPRHISHILPPPIDAPFAVPCHCPGGDNIIFNAFPSRLAVAADQVLNTLAWCQEAALASKTKKTGDSSQGQRGGAEVVVAAPAQSDTAGATSDGKKETVVGEAGLDIGREGTTCDGICGQRGRREDEVLSGQGAVAPQGPDNAVANIKKREVVNKHDPEAHPASASPTITTAQPTPAPHIPYASPPSTIRGSRTPSPSASAPAPPPSSSTITPLPPKLTTTIRTTSGRVSGATLPSRNDTRDEMSCITPPASTTTPGVTDIADKTESEVTLDKETKAARGDAPTTWQFTWPWAYPWGKADDFDGGAAEYDRFVKATTKERLMALRGIILSRITLAQAKAFDEVATLAIIPLRSGHLADAYGEYPRNVDGYFLRGTAFGTLKVKDGVVVETEVIESEVVIGSGVEGDSERWEGLLRRTRGMLLVELDDDSDDEDDEDEEDEEYDEDDEEEEEVEDELWVDSGDEHDGENDNEDDGEDDDEDDAHEQDGDEDDDGESGDGNDDDE